MNFRNMVWVAAIACMVLIGGVLIVYSATPQTRLILATTTSTVDTGLLDYLKPYFDLRFHANLTWLYLGTGQAITVASRGDADILLVHDRVKENAFIQSGNGSHRVTIMYNDFLIVGSATDPAGLANATSAMDAFQKIAVAGDRGQTKFVSRGDGSGTNALELRMWTKAGVAPKVRIWYLDAGSGMAPTLRIANEKGAYTISDRGTWLKLKSEMADSLQLTVLYEGDRDLLNPYGLILLNQTKYPNTNWQLAENFFLFLISDEGQRLIGDYMVGNQQLFTPLFGIPETIGLPPETSEVQYWVAKLTENHMSPPSWVPASAGGQRVGGA